MWRTLLQQMVKFQWLNESNVISVHFMILMIWLTISKFVGDKHKHIQEYVGSLLSNDSRKKGLCTTNFSVTLRIFKIFTVVEALDSLLSLLSLGRRCVALESVSIGHRNTFNSLPLGPYPAFQSLSDLFNLLLLWHKSQLMCHPRRFLWPRVGWHEDERAFWTLSRWHPWSPWPLAVKWVSFGNTVHRPVATALQPPGSSLGILYG